MKERFDYYGLILEVISSSADLLEEVRRDFSYFRTNRNRMVAKVIVHMHLEPPTYANLPPVRASLCTPRNICFQSKGISYIDYFSKGLAVFDRNKGTCQIYGTDPDLVREIAYLFILSTVGRHLDAKGLHRVHALGVSYEQKGILLLLPSGGGKSTMALKLLNHPGFLLLSEDTPLIDRRGRILPFPLRLGVRPDKNQGVPEKYLRTVQRMEFDPKTLIDIDYFWDRLGPAAAPGIILVGERNLGEISEIIPISRLRAFKALLKYAVVGLGIYQGLEFLLERSGLEIISKGGVAISRLHNSVRILNRSRTYKFVLGRDTEKNCRTFLDFVQCAPGERGKERNRQKNSL